MFVSLNNAKPIDMKTIAVFYEAETPENCNRLALIKKVVCVNSTEAEYYKTRNAYLENPEYSKALSFCWWLEDAEADRILNKVLERNAAQAGIAYETV
jgi:hypothetical protein